MGQFSNVLLAIDNAHIVPQRALDCGRDFFSSLHIFKICNISDAHILKPILWNSSSRWAFFGTFTPILEAFTLNSNTYCVSPKITRYIWLQKWIKSFVDLYLWNIQPLHRPPGGIYHVHTPTRGLWSHMINTLVLVWVMLVITKCVKVIQSWCITLRYSHKDGLWQHWLLWISP